MLELKRPHGFLMWKGKKTAVLRPDDQPLDVGVAMEVQTDGEAFGVATLGKPAQMLDAEADRKEYFGEHRVYPHERKKWWPGETRFFVYPVDQFEPYPETLKQGEGAPGYREGAPACEDCTHEGSGYCRLYSFAAEKGWTCDDFMDWRGDPVSQQKEGVMPYDIEERDGEFCVVKQGGEVVKCHASQEKADAHLTALRKNVEAEEEGEGEKYSPDQPRVPSGNPDGGQWASGGDGGALPQDLSTMSESQQMETIKFLAKKPLKELRRRQDIVTKQLAKAMKDSNEAAISNLRVKEALLIDAIMVREFPDDPDIREWLGGKGGIFEPSEEAKERIKALEAAPAPEPEADPEPGEDGQKAQLKKLMQEVEDLRAELEKAQEQTGSSDGKVQGQKESEDAAAVAPEPEQDEKKWDGSDSRWSSAEAYCKDCLIDVNPSGEPKKKSHCKLPFRDPGSGEAHKGAIRAMSTGGRGFPALKKPDDVDSGKWSAAVSRAKARARSYWKKMYDTDIPDAFKDAEDGVGVDDKAGRRIRRSIVEKLREAWQALEDVLSFAEYEDQAPPSMLDWFKADDAGFMVKEVKGEPWLITRSANAFKDRDEEMFSTEGLERYVLESEKKDQRGWFNFWHVPGTDFAEKKWQGVVGETGGVLVEAGPFLDTDLGRKAMEFFKQFPNGHPDMAPEGWGCSVEYRYLPEERSKGVYDRFWVTRTSVLPRLAAANTWTDAQTTKGGTDMALTDKQREGLEIIFPEDAEDIVRDTEDQAKKLKEQGVEHKAADDAGEQAQAAPAEIDLEALAVIIAKQFDVQLEPVTDMHEMLEKQAKELATLKQRLARREKAAAWRAEDEMPRLVLSYEKRASEAEESALDDEDPLLKMKPETPQQPASGSGADHFFGPR